MAVPKSTFYRYAKNTAMNEVAQFHGNSGLCKSRLHTLQAIATLRCILEKFVDHILIDLVFLHSTRRLLLRFFHHHGNGKEPSLN